MNNQVWAGVVVSVLVGVAAGCSGGHAVGPKVTGSVTAVTFLPEMAAEPARAAHVLNQDGAVPTTVVGGTLWTFGDTFMGTKGEDGKTQFAGAKSNTMAFLKEGEKRWPPRLTYLTGADGAAESPLSLVAEEDEKTRRLWPLAGVWVHEAGTELETGRAYMFYGLVEVTGPGPWGFAGVGTGLARANKAFGKYERLRDAAGSLGAWRIDPSSIVRGNGHLYLYAPRKFGGENDNSSGLLVGRVKEGGIEDPHRYEFFAGLSDDGVAQWAASPEEAKPAAGDVWGQASVAWSPYLKGYLLATSSNFFHNDQIQLRIGTMPWGPWEPLRGDAAGGVVVKDGYVRVPEREGEKTQLIYCTMLHPELDEDGGRVITLTFCRMLTREWAFTNPEGVRVELGRK